MNKIIFAILIMFSSLTMATTPCHWGVNWGYVDDLTTNSGYIRFKLIGGQTQGSTSKEYILNVTNDRLFEENLYLINQAFFMNKQIKVNTVQCVGVPSVGVINYVRITR